MVILIQTKASKFEYDVKNLPKENNCTVHIRVILMAEIHPASEASSMTSGYLATTIDTQARTVYRDIFIALIFCQ